jgi:thioredoxin-like negative regulator of GroEL
MLFERAHRAEPLDVNSQFRWAQVLDRNGDHDRAAQIYQEILRKSTAWEHEIKVTTADAKR